MGSSADNRVVFMTTAQEQEAAERRHRELLAATLPDTGKVDWQEAIRADLFDEGVKVEALWRVRLARAIQEEVRKLQEAPDA